MLHRWIGYIAAIQAILHSLLFLALGIQQRVINAWQRDHAWVAGSIATVAVTLIAPLALGLVRKTMYELFLMLHIGATVTLLVGTYYHLFYLYDGRNGGYLYYIWIAIAFWAFDRLARIGRIASNGIRTAQVTIIDKDYIRLDIANAKAEGHAYLYFPTLTPLMFWENHVSLCKLCWPTSNEFQAIFSRIKRHRDHRTTRTSTNAAICLWPRSSVQAQARHLQPLHGLPTTIATLLLPLRPPRPDRERSTDPTARHPICAPDDQLLRAATAHNALQAPAEPHLRRARARDGREDE
jgi:hypothetical protein